MSGVSWEGWVWRWVPSPFLFKVCDTFRKEGVVGVVGGLTLPVQSVRHLSKAGLFKVCDTFRKPIVQ
jgi:hypothetical protein